MTAAPFEAVAHQLLPAMTAFDALQSRTVGSGARLSLRASAPGGNHFQQFLLELPLILRC